MRINFTLLLLVCLCSSRLLGQMPDAETLKHQQREKLSGLKMLDGHWRGTAWRLVAGGERFEMTQTERVGDMLDGCVKVIEGRGYDRDAKTVFNAVAMIAYDPATQQVVMRSHAEGRVGNFNLEVLDDGFAWEIPAGPNTVRYTAKISDHEWFEYGELNAPGRDPMRIFEMRLTKLGTTDWPAAGAVPAAEDAVSP